MRRTSHWLALFSLVGLLTARGGEFPDGWTWEDDAKVRAEHKALEGKPMPPLSLSGWVNGEVKPGDMKGNVVVVDFYATWCGPCIAAIPHNNELLKKYKSKGLVIVGVCTSKRGQEKMEQTVKDKGPNPSSGMIAWPSSASASIVIASCNRGDSDSHSSDCHCL